MRRHAKAANAGSTKRRAKTKPALLACALAACVAALALVVGSASGSTTRFLQETFGSSAQPSFPADRGIAVDQSTNEVYVLDATEDTLYRFNSDGSASNFSALGSNAIDGEGTGDETPQVGLSIPSNRKESQIAIDESGTATDGDIYVAGGSAHRVDIFSSAGEYKGQLTEYSGGALGETCGVAVDGSGNVYVGDYNHGVHVYEPAANPPVNGDNSATYTTAANPCTMAAGAGATEGFLFVDRYNGELLKLDAATGEVKYAITTGASTVSVDPATGHVFVARNTGTSSQVDEYDASGAGSATLVSAFKPGSTAEGVAANGASEEVYVSRSGTENVSVYGAAKVVPDVVTEAASSNTGYRATIAGTVNPDGVELDECFFEWGPNPVNGPAVYGNVAPCAETPAEIGAGTTPVAVHADLTGLIPQGGPFAEGASGYEYRLVAANPNGAVNGSNQTFNQIQTVFAEAVSGSPSTEATLNGSVNPDTATISACAFEWGVQKKVTDAVQAYETAPCVPGPGGITGESPVAVSATVSGLHPGTTYVYRLKVTYPSGAVVDPQYVPLTLQTPGPVIAASWAQDVTFTEAALKARINPEGAATTYHFEYGKTEAYGSETDELNVGSDSSTHEVARFLDDLDPGTTYHYRVIATSGVAENVGPDHTLATFEHVTPETNCPNQAARYGASANLPDCRAYEMVTPVEKSAHDIVARGTALNYAVASDQARPDGDKFTYSTATAFGDAQGSYWTNQFMATRGPGGWSNHGISPLHAYNTAQTLDTVATPPKFGAFTEDLSHAYLLDNAMPPLNADALLGKYNVYLRDNVAESYETVTKQVFGSGDTSRSAFMGYSKDGGHMVFTSRTPLTPGLPPNSEPVYDFHDGELDLVSVLPSGEPAIKASVGNADAHDAEEIGDAEHAISDDGSVIFWEAKLASGTGAGSLYARVDGETTVPVSDSVGAGSQAAYWTASNDGSSVIFSVGRDLYKFDVETETPTLIASGVDEERGVLGAGGDDSYVYFLSDKVLAAGATAGLPNLYLDREGEKRFVVTLTRDDERNDKTGYRVASNQSAVADFSRVTPDGRYLFFQSLASLTGHDNASRDTGERAMEVYRYDADAAELTCISCNPSGERPRTDLLPKPNRPRDFFKGVQAAAWLQTPRRGAYIPRMIADDGSYAFFNAFDALVPRDTNGVADVYEWVEQGVDGCAETEGCVSLISTGVNSKASTFVDASADGSDVFLRTAASIDPEDPGLIDIYDARVDGGFPRPESPPECFGDACQSVPAAPQFDNPASANFHGAGNPQPVRNCSKQGRKAKKLSNRAKRLRRHGKQAKRNGKSAIAKKRNHKATRLAQRARSKSKRAKKRCRRANRRASR